jgi:LPS sulfotransferase NodH
VSYEELIADMDGVTRAILHFLSLEVDGTWTAASPHGRQSDEVNADWIARYRAEAAN